jgi:TATA-box binding protein (TBP) (component of TFIID and TFIIIB)
MFVLMIFIRSFTFRSMMNNKYCVFFSYEPELHPGVTYKLYNPKATLKIFSTGGVTITGMHLLLLISLHKI